MTFIALTSIYDPRQPKIVHIRADDSRALWREHGIDRTIVVAPNHPNSGIYKVKETPEQILAMIEAARGFKPDHDMARLLAAVWAPDMDITGPLRLEAVAEFLGQPPTQICATFERAQQLARQLAKG
jgi:hypothetical protein